MQELFGEVRNGGAAHVAQAKHVVAAALNAVKVEGFSTLRTAKAQLDATLPKLFDRAGLDVRRSRAATDAEFNGVVRRSHQTIWNASNAAQALFREIAGQGPQKTLGQDSPSSAAPTARPLRAPCSRHQQRASKLRSRTARSTRLYGTSNSEPRLRVSANLMVEASRDGSANLS